MNLVLLENKEQHYYNGFFKKFGIYSSSNAIEENRTSATVFGLGIVFEIIFEDTGKLANWLMMEILGFILI